MHRFLDVAGLCGQRPISNDVWSAPVVLSCSDTIVGSVSFAVAPGTPGLTAWVTGSATPQIHAVVRATATGTWSGPVTVSRPSSGLAPEAAAVSSPWEALSSSIPPTTPPVFTLSTRQTIRLRSDLGWTEAATL